MGEQYTVQQLIEGLESVGVGDTIRSYKEMSGHSQDIQLLLMACDPAKYSDYIAVWQWARGTGMYRRCQRLAAGRGLPLGSPMQENPWHARPEILAWAEALLEYTREWAQELREELMVEASGVMVPVVDAEEGGDVYGYATERADALKLAQERFADPVERVYLHAHNFTTTEGEQFPRGWVALTAGAAAAAQSAPQPHQSAV